MNYLVDQLKVMRWALLFVNDPKNKNHLEFTTGKFKFSDPRYQQSFVVNT